MLSSPITWNSFAVIEEIFSTPVTPVYIVGEAPGVTSWVPLKHDAAIPADFNAVRLLPCAGSGLQSKLREAGFCLAETLSYQFRDPSVKVRHQSYADVFICRVTDAEGALVFAQVQDAGFLEQEDQSTSWWRESFPKIALRNYHDPAQDFFIAYVAGSACAVLLMLHSHGISGVYAVATRPDWRGRGLSSALLSRGAEEAVRRGSSLVMLQAMQGSYAAGFYKRRGFSEAYASTVWRRQPAYRDNPFAKA